MKYLPSLRRRQALAALIASGASLFVGKSLANEPYPSKYIVVVVPFPPGGSIDPILRPFMEAAARELGQPIVLMNRPGAGGITGTGSVAMMNEADGYTVGVMHNSVIRAPLIQKVPWDPLRGPNLSSELVWFNHRCNCRGRRAMANHFGTTGRCQGAPRPDYVGERWLDKRESDIWRAPCQACRHQFQHGSFQGWC